MTKPSWWLIVFATVLAGCGGAVAPAGNSPRGRELAVEKNCASCHTTSGARSVGPTWDSLAGSEVELESGRVVVADAAYLAASIRNPQAELVAGFNVVSMPTLDLTDDEVAALVEYIQSLGRGSSPD